MCVCVCAARAHVCARARVSVFSELASVSASHGTQAYHARNAPETFRPRVSTPGGVFGTDFAAVHRRCQAVSASLCACATEVTAGLASLWTGKAQRGRAAAKGEAFFRAVTLGSCSFWGRARCSWAVWPAKDWLACCGPTRLAAAVRPLRFRCQRATRTAPENGSRKSSARLLAHTTRCTISKAFSARSQDIPPRDRSHGIPRRGSDSSTGSSSSAGRRLSRQCSRRQARSAATA